MIITFYNTSKKRNSTFQPGGGTSYTGQLTNESGMVNPTVIMDFGNSAPSYNYAYINEFNRYYWLNEITSVGGGLWRVQMTSDPLASFKTAIGNSYQYVLRSSNTWDGDITDLRYPTKAKFTANRDSVSSGYGSLIGNYLVGVVSPNGQLGAVSYFTLSETQFATLRNNLMGTGDPYYASITDVNQRNMAIVMSNPMQYIVSARYYPFQLPGGNVEPMKLGNYPAGSYPPTTGLTIPHTTSLNLTSHPKAQTRGAYMNTEPFTQRFIYWEPIGLVHLPGSLIAGVSTLYFSMNLDIVSGIGRMEIFSDSAYSALIMANSFVLGYDVPVAQMVSGNPLKIISGTVSLFSAGVSAMTGNVSGAISGGIGAIGDFLTANIPELQSFKPGSGSQLPPGNIQLIEIFYDVADDDVSENGRPLCQSKQLSTIPGYILCEHGEVNAAGATEGELATIADYLTGGFYYQ